MLINRKGCPIEAIWFTKPKTILEVNIKLIIVTRIIENHEYNEWKILSTCSGQKFLEIVHSLGTKGCASETQTYLK